jgi:hypothetical protein
MIVIETLTWLLAGSACGALAVYLSTTKIVSIAEATVVGGLGAWLGGLIGVAFSAHQMIGEYRSIGLVFAIVGSIAALMVDWTAHHRRGPAQRGL